VLIRLKILAGEEVFGRNLPEKLLNYLRLIDFFSRTDPRASSSSGIRLKEAIVC
jgi:hypothetical protein